MLVFKPLLVFVFSMGVVLPSLLTAGEESPGGSREVAATKLTDAMRAELVGDPATRRALLLEAASLDPQSQLARAQLGMIQGEGTHWLSVERSVEEYRRDEKIAEYESKRSATEDTVEAQWALAQWCERNKLADQQRTHLHRIIRLNPEHVAARTALGYRRIGIDWISPQQLQTMAEQAKYVKSSFGRFGKTVQSIARSLDKSPQGTNEQAVVRLNKISDPLAIPAVAAAFGQSRAEVTEHGLRWLHQQNEQRAGLALCQFALFHDSDEVRYSASQKLAERDLYEYAPSAIDLVNCPILTGLVPYFNSDGMLQGYRHLLYREGAERNDLMVVDTEYFQRGPAPNNPLDGLLTSIDVVGQAVQSAASREQLVSAQNAQTNLLNARVASLLSHVSGSTIPADATEIRDWWYKTNETEASRLRSFRYARVYDQVAYTSSTAFGGGACECFVEGTPVMTRKGLMPIEKISIGDLVLSKDVQTGLLAWKPVLERTERPPTELVQMSVGDETFRCTPGHVFWVSGKGWRKASTVQAGDVLHGAEAPTTVDQIVAGGNEATFNLIVADHANYFVGKQLILSHDFTPRSYTSAVIPGVLGVQ